MKLLSITLGNNLGELAVIGQADISTKNVLFQSIVGGIVVFQSEIYEEARETIMSVFELHQSNKRKAN